MNNLTMLLRIDFITASPWPMQSQNMQKLFLVWVVVLFAYKEGTNIYNIAAKSSISIYAPLRSKFSYSHM